MPILRTKICEFSLTLHCKCVKVSNTDTFTRKRAKKCVEIPNVMKVLSKRV